MLLFQNLRLFITRYMALSYDGKQVSWFSSKDTCCSGQYYPTGMFLEENSSVGYD